MEKLTKCNLCGSDKFTLYLRKKGVVTGKILDIVKCENCGLVFVNPRLTEKENLDLYNKDYFTGKGFDESVDYVHLIENKNEEEKSPAIINKICLFKPKKSIKILDIGCGTGSFVKTLENKGYNNVTGLEFSSFAGGYAKKHCHSKIIIDDFLKHDFKSEKFEVIIADGVIEHLRDPLEFFKKVKRLLKKDGLFMFYMGNLNSLYSKIFKRRWPFLRPEGHLFYFSPPIIKKYFERVGLDIIEFDRLNKNQRKNILKYQDEISYFFLKDVGRNAKGLKGLFCYIMSKLPKSITGRFFTSFLDEYRWPLAVNKK